MAKKPLPFSVFFALSMATLTLLLLHFGWWQVQTSGQQLSVPMFYDAHYLFPRAWTQEQSAPARPHPAPLALWGENRLTQRFSADSSLDAVAVWIGGTAPVQVGMLGEKGWATQLTPQSAEPRPYFLPRQPYHDTLYLYAPTATAEQPIVLQTIGGNRLGGDLRLNEYPQAANLRMATYTHGQGWHAIGRQLLPATFQLRLQQYKPTPYKGATFPLLLTVIVILTLIWLIAALPAPLRTLPFAFNTIGLSLAIFLVWQFSTQRLLLNPPLLAPLPNLADIPNSPVLPNQTQLTQTLASWWWTAERWPEPRLTDLSADGVTGPANSRFTFALTVPYHAQLHIGVRGGQGLQIRLGEALLWESAEAVNHPLLLDLSPYGGQETTLSLISKGTGEAVNWIHPQISARRDWVVPPPPNPAPILFAQGAVALLGWELSAETVTLIWQRFGEIDGTPTIFLHLLDSNGNLIAQHDGQPVLTTYPFSLFPLGLAVRDTHPLPIGTLGQQNILVGLYNAQTGQRYPLTTGQEFYDLTLEREK